MPLAARITGPRHLEVYERPRLAPSSGEAVVDVEACGVCGTDLALYTGDYQVPLPLVPGHEIVGIVSEVGAGSDPALVGMRVVVEINNTCTAYGRADMCSACARGMPTHCQSRTVTGIIRRDGGYAEELSVPAGALHRVPQDSDPIAATLVEPLAAALQTFVMTPLAPGDLVVVLGPGRLGALIAFVAALAGARVVACARSEARRARALRLGAHHAVSPEHAKELVRDLTSGLGADVVVESTGAEAGLAQALALVRPRGTIAAKTTCGIPARGLDATRLVVDEVRIQGSRCGPFPEALACLRAHGQRLRALITSTRPLGEAPAAMEAALREDKVVLTMDATS